MKGPAAPLALYEKTENALKIAALDRAATAEGLYEGQPLAEARALLPALNIAAIDRAADRRDFQRLLAALLRYSPLVGSPEFGAAFIDIEGVAHLFGGEARLAEDAANRLRGIGVDARAAIAGTPGCAWATAAFGAFPVIPSGGERSALSPLPVAALRLEADIVDDLKSLGLKTVGAVMARPRKELGKRFGEALLKRLDQATGALFEPIAPIAPPADFSASAVLAEPLMTIDATLHLADDLAARLARKLEAAGQGARRFDFSLFRMDMSFETVRIALGAPSRAPETILRLLRLKLEKGERPVDPGFGFESFRLSAFATARIDAAKAQARETGAGEEVDALRDRLANHLGRAVFRLSPVASHIPERAEARASALLPPVPWTNESAMRPLSLLDPPEPILATALAPDGPPAQFRWRRVAYRTARAAGPERILGEWRRGEDFSRDYYRIEDEKGRRYWVFREGRLEDGAKWFLHGFFA